MKITEYVKQSIDAVVRKFQSNPFDFLYESDLQCLLYAKLFECFGEKRSNITCGYHPPTAYGNKHEIQTTILKSEYPSVVRYDLVLLDSDSPLHYNEQRDIPKKLENDPLWIQPLRAIIELKFLQPGDNWAAKKQGFRSDIDRVVSYRKNYRPTNAFIGICILFVSDHRIKEEGYDTFVFGSESEFDAIDDGIWGIVVTPSQTTTFAVQ